MNTQINTETATEEVNAWLGRIKLSPRKRVEKTKEIDKLIEMVCYGEVRFNEDGNPVQKLIEPIPSFEELTYASRIKVEALISKSKAEGSNDAFTMTAVFVSVATGISVGLAKKLDSKDLEIPGIILGFFQ
jgi:hypothetical protein